MRLAFMGSPEFSVYALRAILEAGHEVVCVYSQPPRPAGRGKAERPTPVHEFAVSNEIEVRTPRTLKSDVEQERFAALELDVAVVVAYGLILPQAVLDAPRHGCLNVHASILPRWRGAAPIQRAIMAGDKETGVDIMQMEAGLDTGPVMLSRQTEIAAEDTAGTLHDRLAGLGAEAIVAALTQIEDGSATFKRQTDEGVTYAHKLTSDETRIDWSKPAGEVRAHIHGLSPFPGAWFELPTSKGAVRVKVLEVVEGAGKGVPGEVLDDQLTIACAQGAVKLLRLQRAGKSAMTADDFLRGNVFVSGDRLA